ncbi:PepSY-associated TM helix domain-containing protein [Dyella caseinilytica]|uniref:PepSY domain-containing protein n=1 Tax=Dyella caseinilytica TaxID=1849581 RepID=A0ABX7GPX5_9GAMM|nr:PepSY domain-containing protein [Dyella caseinilytica]QRN52111.1 PepSY domain-containing protein [Dyella caseinilytica]GGA15309.1 peptidase [Dyella caseinilytica]
MNQNPAPSTRKQNAYRLIWRWHFYAGLFCLPFVLWLATTGLIYLFKPQLEPLLERRYAHVSTAPAQPASAQVAAALRAVPGSVLNAYVLPESPEAATRILVGHGSELIRVFVNPATLQVLGVVRENDRFMKVIFYLHGELLLGSGGSMVVELAASWTILMLITGLYLWWPRNARLGGTLYPRLRQGKRIFWRDLHAVIGMWISLFALFLLLSGLPWSKSWGGMLHTIRQTYAANTATQDWTTGSASERAQIKAENTPASGEHAMHMAMGMNMPGMDMGDTQGGMLEDYSPIDRLVPIATAQHLAPPVLIAPPSQHAPHWTARSDADDRPSRSTLTLDAATGAILQRTSFAQKPLLDRIIGYGIAIHEGALFPPINQILGVFTALGLMTLCTSAIVMWWRRRPISTLGAPPAMATARYPYALITFLVCLGVFLPLLGMSMLLVWLIEWLCLRRIERARVFLGLSAQA